MLRARAIYSFIETPDIDGKKQRLLLEEKTVI
jgi:hypothetical protein